MPHRPRHLDETPDMRDNLKKLDQTGKLPEVLAGGPQRPWWMLPSVALAIIVVTVLWVAL